MKKYSKDDWRVKLTLEFSGNPQEIGRAIARELDAPWSSVWDFKQRLLKGEVKYNDVLTKPKILVFDIETAPILGDVWSLWNNNVSLNQIRQDWFMLSWAAKWLGEEDIYSDYLLSELPHTEDFVPDDDLLIVKSLWKMLDEADIIIGHNLKKFDNKKFKARCLAHGLREPSSYRMVDTLEIAKKSFNLTSNKLDYLATLLGLPNKISHEGHQLWVKCMAGVPEAWETMVEYNEYDVELLEEVYLKIRHWFNGHPNVAVFYNDLLERCTVCGSEHLELTGNTVKSNLGEYEEVRCKNCTKLSRRGTNLLGKEKRGKLLRNIVR